MEQVSFGSVAVDGVADVAVDGVAAADGAEDNMSPPAVVPIDHGMSRTDKVRFCKHLSNAIDHQLVSIYVVRILHSVHPTNGP